MAVSAARSRRQTQTRYQILCFLERHQISVFLRKDVSASIGCLNRRRTRDAVFSISPILGAVTRADFVESREREREREPVASRIVTSMPAILFIARPTPRYLVSSTRFRLYPPPSLSLFRSLTMVSC